MLVGEEEVREHLLLIVPIVVYSELTDESHFAEMPQHTPP